MPKFLIRYGRSAHDDHSGKSIQTENGSFVFEAESLEQATNIGRCIHGTETHSQEGYYVESVIPYTGPDEAKGYSWLREMVNPYGISKDGMYSRLYPELERRIRSIDPTLVRLLL